MGQPKERMDREQRFQEVVAGHGAALWRIARGYAGPSGETEDLYQDILLQIWRSLDSYRGESSLGTWVYRVGLNTALSSRRQTRRRDAVEVVDGAVAEVEAAAPAESPVRILEEFILGLEPIDRSVMLLYAEGLSHDEIGKVTGLSRSAAAVRLHRLKQRFIERYVEA